MKYIMIMILVLGSGLVGSWVAFSGSDMAASEIVSAESNSATATDKKRLVLVELFTSEGCSSCPPADRVLTTLENDQLVPNANVVTLAFHVDYWNYLGWKDRFSSSAFSKRQEEYARRFRNNSSYTPQIVVDGTAEFVGSNRAKANEVIGKSAAEAKATIDLALNANKLTVTTSDLGKHSEATVYLAVAESKLFTNVAGGENRGEKLEHTSVVRDLIKIGKIKSSEGFFRGEADIPVNSEWKSENVKYVVFVQENEGTKVLAVGQITRR